MKRDRSTHFQPTNTSHTSQTVAASWYYRTPPIMPDNRAFFPIWLRFMLQLSGFLQMWSWPLSHSPPVDLTWSLLGLAHSRLLCISASELTMAHSCLSSPCWPPFSLPFTGYKLLYNTFLSWLDLSSSFPTKPSCLWPSCTSSYSQASATNARLH